MLKYDAAEKIGELGYLRLSGELVGEVTLEQFKRGI